MDEEGDFCPTSHHERLARIIFQWAKAGKSQDAVEAIRLQDRVIEKSIRRPPVERFGPPVPFFSSNCFL